MIKRIKERLLKDEATGTTIKLPMSGLYPHVDFYHPYDPCEGKRSEDISKSIPMALVVIYNVEQLAEEIVKRLKDGASDRSNGNNESK